jgi:hypothetical protein
MILKLTHEYCPLDVSFHVHVVELPQPAEPAAVSSLQVFIYIVVPLLAQLVSVPDVHVFSIVTVILLKTVIYRAVLSRRTHGYTSNEVIELVLGISTLK